jgi:hypothetical protein
MYIPLSKENEKVETSAEHYITIPAQIYADLCECVKHYDTEVSGCGMVERIEHRYKDKDKDKPDIVSIEFRISEIYLPDKQDNTGASTDIDDDVIAELLNQLLKDGKNTEHLRLHWHSHADMDTFHSGTDEDNYATLSNGEFLVSLVLNKANKVLGRIDYFNPIRVNMSGVCVYMITEETIKPSKGIIDSIKKLDKYVKDKPVVKSYDMDNEYVGYNGYNGYSTLCDTKKLGLIRELDKDELEIARQLKISVIDATKFKSCHKILCEKCDQVVECSEFLYHTDNYDL